MAARWPDTTPVRPVRPGRVSPDSEQFLADLAPLAGLDPVPDEPFAVFAACGPTGPPSSTAYRDDPETVGERYRDEPTDDWTIDRRLDRYETAIYGEHR